MEKKKKYLRRHEGFTLIEIIVVLIVLGILAAFAVPKFFTIADQTRDKALSGAASELKGRVKEYFARQLEKGATAGQIDYTGTTVDMNLGSDFKAVLTSGPKDDPITGTITIQDGSGRTMNWSMKRPDI